MSGIHRFLAMATCASMFAGGCSQSSEKTRQPDAQPTAESTKQPVLSEENKHQVALFADSGTFTVPVTINESIKLNFTLDSGASDVIIPSDVIKTMVRSGTLDRSDFIGQRIYKLADGSTLPSYAFRIRSLQLGDVVVHNVVGSIAAENGSLLLGQSFLSRVSSWSIDNRRGVLVLGGVLNGGDAIPVPNEAPSRPNLAANDQASDPQSNPRSDSSNEESGRTVMEYYLRLGGENDISQIHSLYAENVNYYGTNRSRDYILTEKSRYIARWPIRTYRMKDGTLESDCTTASYCSVASLVDWTASNPASGRFASGVARVALVFSQGQVTSESSKVVSRN